MAANKTPNAERNRNCTITMSGSQINDGSQPLPEKNCKTSRKAILTPSGMSPSSVAAMGSNSVLNDIFFTRPALPTMEFDAAVNASVFASHGP